LPHRGTLVKTQRMPNVMTWLRKRDHNAALGSATVAQLRPRSVARNATARPTRPADSTAPEWQRPRITIVVPTYKEVASLPHLIDRVARVRAQHALEIDMLIMDDDSQDGSVELIEARPETWVRIIVRTGQRGLSAAVLDGMQRAQGEMLVCMDADLSHPPECLPMMLRKLREGADFVVGSRYVKGGSTADDWGILRWLNSRAATAMARPLTAIRDPMAGFFALARKTYEQGRDFNPIGYKIGLELLVKCRCERVVEVPIHFENRRFGESKMTFKQQLLYLQHLRRLYIYKYGLWSQLLQFLVVGGIGTLVNLAALTGMMAGQVPIRTAVALAIWISMTSNFMLNRRFSFSFARHGSWWGQYLRFVAASSVGAVVNYALTVLLLNHFAHLPAQAAALVGIAVGTGINFAASRYLVFRNEHMRLSSSQPLH
jgi:dolichol-phosphate mannosyltransferase